MFYSKKCPSCNEKLPFGFLMIRKFDSCSNCKIKIKEDRRQIIFIMLIALLPTIIMASAPTEYFLGYLIVLFIVWNFLRKFEVDKG